MKNEDLTPYTTVIGRLKGSLGSEKNERRCFLRLKKTWFGSVYFERSFLALFAGEGMKEELSSRRAGKNYDALLLRSLVPHIIVALLITLFIIGPFLTFSVVLLPTAVGLALLALLLWLYIILSGRLPSRSWVFLFVISYTLFDFVYSIFLQNKASETLRSIAPLLVFGVSGLAVCVSFARGREIAVTAVLLYGVATAIEIIPYFVQSGFGEALSQRFTAYSDNAHTPAMIAAVPLLFVSMTRNIRWILYLLCFLAIISTKSKGQIIVFILISIFSVIFVADLRDRKLFFAGLFPTVVLLLVLMSQSSQFAKSFSRMKASNVLESPTTDHRLEELRAAINDFMHSPLLGRGAGYEFTFYSSVTDKEVTQNYIHNLVGYLLVKHGVLGLLIYLLPFAYAVTIVRVSNRKQVAYFLAGFSILLYGLFSASFKSLQANIFLGVLFGATIMNPKKMYSKFYE